MSIIFIFSIVIIVGIHYSFVQTSENENQLIHYLFDEQGYNPFVRPTKYSNETVVIAFALLLVQLIHVSNIHRDLFYF